jgi:polar amino acid transport system substrate-binding protein
MSATAVYRRLAAALLAVLMLAWMLPAAAQTDKPRSGRQHARVLINDAPPYRIVGTENGRPSYSGLYVDILRLVAADLDLELDFVELPFARAFRAMEAGGADIMLGPNRSVERETYLRYLDPPLPREPKVFLQTRTAPPIRDYGDLTGRSIAVLRGATYFDPFDGDTALDKIVVDDYPAAMRLVSLGRVDAMVIPELQAVWLLRQGGFQLQVAPWRVAGRDSHIVLARTSPLMDRINEIEAALLHVMTGSALPRILQRYE